MMALSMSAAYRSRAVGRSAGDGDPARRPASRTSAGLVQSASGVRPVPHRAAVWTEQEPGSEASVTGTDASPGRRTSHGN